MTHFNKFTLNIIENEKTIFYYCFVMSLLTNFCPKEYDWQST